MTDNNYRIGINATLVGWVAGPAKPPLYDKEGTSGVLEVSIPIREGYTKDGSFVETGTTWYSYSAAGEYANNLRSLNKGDKVLIEGAKLEVREKDGKFYHSLRYGNLVVLESRSQSNDLVAAGASTDSPW